MDETIINEQSAAKIATIYEKIIGLKITQTELSKSGYFHFKMECETLHQYLDAVVNSPTKQEMDFNIKKLLYLVKSIHEKLEFHNAKYLNIQHTIDAILKELLLFQNIQHER